MKRMSTKFLGLFLVMVMVSTMLPAALPVSAAVASIDEVKLTLAEPTVGGSVTASVTITGENKFTVKEAHWIHGGTFETNPGVAVGTETTEFEAGRPYYAGITLTANDGYNFTSTTIVEIAGFTVENTEIQNSATELYIKTADFTVPGQVIDSASLSLTMPVIGGDTTAEAAITGGEGFTIYTANWFNSSTAQEAPGAGASSFDAGKAYFAEIELTAEDGYLFTDATNVSLTGATIKSTAVDNGGKKLTVTTVDVTPTEQPIASISIELTEPVAGGSTTAEAEVTAGDGVTVVSAYWFNSATAEEAPGAGASSFDAGKAYFAEIELSAADGYLFTDATSVTLSGATVKSTVVERGGKVLIITTEDVTLDETSGEEPSYEVLDGDGQEFDPEDPADLTIRFDGPFDKVLEVLVDDETLAPENYELSEGSTVVTLKEDYLNTLEAGAHTVAVKYEGDKVSEKASITIVGETENSDGESSDTESSTTESSAGGEESQKDENSDNPKTGDSLGLYAAVALMLISFLGMAIVTVLKKKAAAER